MASQSNVIAGALLVGFVVFITTRGELPEYVGLFTLKRVEAKPKKKGLFGVTFSEAVDYGYNNAKDAAEAYFAGGG